MKTTAAGKAVANAVSTTEQDKEKFVEA